MTKQRIAILGIVIIGIALGRYLLKRMDKEAVKVNRESMITYVLDTAHVRTSPQDTAQILYTLLKGDSVIIYKYDRNWRELESGGFIHSNTLQDTTIKMDF